MPGLPPKVNAGWRALSLPQVVIAPSPAPAYDSDSTPKLFLHPKPSFKEAMLCRMEEMTGWL